MDRSSGGALAAAAGYSSVFVVSMVVPRRRRRDRRVVTSRSRVCSQPRLTRSRESVTIGLPCGREPGMKVGYKALIEAAEKEIESLTVADGRRCSARTTSSTSTFATCGSSNARASIPGAFHAPRGMLEFWVDPG